MNKNLLIRYFSRETSVEEGKALLEWIKKNPDNKSAFREAESIWKLTGSLNELHSWDTDQNWEQLKRQIQFEKNTVNKKPQFLRLKIAASILLLITVGLGIKGVLFNTQTGKPEVVVKTNPKVQKEIPQTIDKGDSLNSKGASALAVKNNSNNSSLKVELVTKNNLNVIFLPDSSLVWINKNSKIRYSKQFDGKERIVYLEGEAFFEVVKNPNQPFVVHAGETKTRVLGTSFNIRAYKNENKVGLTVVSGTVEFSFLNKKMTAKKIIVVADEIGFFDKNNNSISKINKGKPNYIAWIYNQDEIRKTSMYKSEISKPFDCLLHVSQIRENLIKRTVVEGKIHNSSVLRTFKNVIMHVDYYNAAGEKVSEGYFTVGKTVLPRQSIKYKQRLDWFDPATKVVVRIADAQTVN